MEERGDTGEDYRELGRKMEALEPAKGAMKELKEIWSEINVESAKPKPNTDRINKLKDMMTKVAKMFLQGYNRRSAKQSRIMGLLLAFQSLICYNTTCLPLF